jgi:DNA polymerase-3 subunit epsilon
MAETLRMMLGANRNFRVTPEGPPEVQQLARPPTIWRSSAMR